LLKQASGTKDASAADDLKIEAAKKQNELDKLHTSKATKSEREHNAIDRMGGYAIGSSMASMGAASKSEQHLSKLVTLQQQQNALMARAIATAENDRAMGRGTHPIADNFE
jgi:hypothetical protein